LSNTNAIIASQGDGNYAAKICADYSVTIATDYDGDVVYDDWYLPSKDELNKLYINRTAIGGFAYHIYWSSTENGTSNAWNQNFYDGGQVSANKNVTAYYVRAIRAF
jgi:hypothetical protein